MHPSTHPDPAKHYRCAHHFLPDRVVRGEVLLAGEDEVGDLHPCRVPAREHLFLAVSWDMERTHGINKHFCLSVWGLDLSRGKSVGILRGSLALTFPEPFQPMTSAGKELLAISSRSSGNAEVPR